VPRNRSWAGIWLGLAVAMLPEARLLVIGRGPRDAAGGRLPTNAYAILRQAPCPVISV